jgi:hypothetical protein
MSIKRILTNSEWDGLRSTPHTPSITNPYTTLQDLATSSSGNLLISGGAVYSGTGLTFDVSALVFSIAGVQYTTLATQVTLTVGDPASSRFDAIVADENNTVTIVQGTPATTPLTPAIGEDQVLIQYILVGQNATTPSITTEYVYREDQTSDWAGSFNGNNTSANFSSTTPTPVSGTYCCLADVGRYGSTRGVRFSTGTPVNREDYVQLSFFVQLTTDMIAAGKQRGYVFAYADNSPSSSEYLGAVRFDQLMDWTLIDQWQLVSIPTQAFSANQSNTTIGFLNFTLWPNQAGYPPTEFALDNIRLLTGYGPGLNIATIDILNNDASVGDTARLNFVDGLNTTVNTVDDNLNNKVDVSIDSKLEIKEASVSIEPSVKGLNFTGSGVTVSTAGGTNPEVTINVPGSAGTGGLVDLTGLTGASDKVDLTSVTSQTRHGYGIKFTAGNELFVGQPVIFDFSSGVVTAITAGSLPSQHEYVGIALANVFAGADVEVGIKGVCTGRRVSTFAPSAETVELDNTTTGTIRSLTNATTFLDSGGSGGDYTGNENYSITFDAGLGYDTKITVNDFEFEHSTFSMYDRLGIQGSNDGVNFTNLTIPWLQTSAITNPPYGTSFGGSQWNSGASDNGWILPENTPRAILIGGVPGNTFPADIVTAYRYIRFYFRSDNSSNANGWDITLAPNTPYSTGTQPVAEGTTLYLDTTDYTRITTDSVSGVVVGFCAYSDASDDSIFMRLK